MRFNEIWDLNEGLPMRKAKEYTKKGRANAEALPDEVKELYSNIFKDKQRIQIGNMEFDQGSRNDRFNNQLSDIIGEISDSVDDSKKDALINDVGIKDGSVYYYFLPISGELDKVTLPNRRLLNSTNTAGLQKYFSRAATESDAKETKYNLTTWFKLIKKYMNKAAVPKIQGDINKYLTAIGKESSNPNVPVILSRHPYDVGGMSTKQSWSSCKSITGCNSHYLDNEVGELLIAYVVNPERKGKDLLSDPLARLLVMPVVPSSADDDDFSDVGLYVSPDVYSEGWSSKNEQQFISVVDEFLSDYTTTYSKDDTDIRIINDYYIDGGNYAGHDANGNGRLSYDTVTDTLADYHKDYWGSKMTEEQQDSIGDVIRNWVDSMWDYYGEENPIDMDDWRRLAGDALAEADYIIDELISTYNVDGDNGDNYVDIARYAVGGGDMSVEDFVEQNEDILSELTYDYDDKTTVDDVLEPYTTARRNGSYDITPTIVSNIVPSWFEHADSVDETIDDIISTIESHADKYEVPESKWVRDRDGEFDDAFFKELRTKLEIIRKQESENHPENPQMTMDLESYVMKL